MKTALVPTFDEFNKYAFVKNVPVKIKNKPDWKDCNKITQLLPGFAQGGSGAISHLMANGQVPVRYFYDSRQRTKMLRGYSVRLSN